MNFLSNIPIQDTLTEIYVSGVKVERVEIYAIDHENMQQRLNSHEDVIKKVHNNMRISLKDMHPNSSK